ncbi:MAG: hypothetical protein L0271_20325 [Gemmatimonadetes bacterium]|nr:hypothetical protein [Gemmatimonadota bacterium]
MARPARESAPWIFWPIAAVWDLIAFVIRLTGRAIGIVISLVLMVLSVILGLTIVGLPLAIPVFLLGFLLLLRSLF